MSRFKDLFSTQATDYSKFRPHYPNELFQWLADQTQGHDAVWDCGTGSGQAAAALSPFYGKVYATDPSEKQLGSAVLKPNIQYTVGTAEASHLAAKSVDLITVAQAYHWFNHDRFFAEAQRVGRPRAVVAVWSYALAKISTEIDPIIKDWHDGFLGPYWEKERTHVSTGYRDLPFAFESLSAPQFQMQVEWSLDHLLGYLGTWSAGQTFLAKMGEDPRLQIIDALTQAWGEPEFRAVRWDLSPRVGRLQNVDSL